MMKRRELLIGMAATPFWLGGCGGSGVSIATGSTPVTQTPQAPEPEVSAGIESLSRARHFKPLEGDVFYIEHPFYGSLDGVMAPLTDVDTDPNLEQFVLGFDLPAGSNLAEGTYKVVHHSGSEMELYMQPDVLDVGGYDRYRAVFSHIKE